MSIRTTSSATRCSSSGARRRWLREGWLEEAELPGVVELRSPGGLDCGVELHSRAARWWARPSYLNSYSSFASGSMA